MKERVYFSGPEEDRASLDQIRRLMSRDSYDALQQVDVLRNLLLMEQNSLPEVVDLDISKGMWVRAVKFVDSSKVKLIFNNGESKFVSQENGVYSIGEHVFSLNTPVVGVNDMNVNAHYRCATLIREKGLAGLTNRDWDKLFYEMLPRVRKNCADDCYNSYDINSHCTRIQHFRSYVTTGLMTILNSIPDYPGTIIIACVEFTSNSRRWFEDLIVAMNTVRQKQNKTPFKITDVTSDRLLRHNDSVYVYYMHDCFVHPSMLDHKVMFGPDSNRDYTDRFQKVLRPYSEMMTSNSSVILSAYKPIADIFLNGRDVVYQNLDGYHYAQHSYVPHKPWTLMIISRDNSLLKHDLPDSTYRSHLSRYVFRYKLNLKMLIVNLNRNRKLADKDSLDLMNLTMQDIASHAFDKLESLKETTVIRDWYQYRCMREVVNIRKTMVALESVNTQFAIKLVVKVNKLDQDKSYRHQDLMRDGWHSMDISRALELQILIPAKSGSSYTYRKYKRENPIMDNYFSSPSIDECLSVTLVDDTGAVYVDRPQVSDKKAIRVKTFLSEGRDHPLYTERAPYSVRDYHSKGIGSVSSKTIMDHNEYYSSEGMKQDYLEVRRKRLVDRRIEILANSYPPPSSSTSESCDDNADDGHSSSADGTVEVFDFSEAAQEFVDSSDESYEIINVDGNVFVPRDYESLVSDSPYTGIGGDYIPVVNLGNVDYVFPDVNPFSGYDYDYDPFSALNSGYESVRY